MAKEKRKDYYEFIRESDADAEQVAGLTMSYETNKGTTGDEYHDDGDHEMDQDEYDPWEDID